MRKLLLNVSILNNGNSDGKLLDNTIKIMEKYDQVLIIFEEGDLNKIFETLKHITHTNIKSTIIAYLGKKACPEVYEEMSI